MPSKDPHIPAPLLGGSSSKPARPSKRQPTGEIVYIPTERGPADWTRKDRSRFSSAVARGVFMGLIVWSLFAGVVLIVLSSPVPSF